jgi:hypothetical protein
MAKLTPEEKEEIVKRYLPGYKLVPQSEESRSPDSTPAERADAGTPDLDVLKRKYFGAGAEIADSAEADSAASDDDDEIVQVEPEQRRDALDRGSRAKSIVISGDKIKGSQG